MEKNLIDSTEELFNSALETMKKKNADYSGDNRTLKNFNVSALVANVTTSQGILVRLCDKVTRIGNLLQKEGEVKDETILDTVQDLINYAAILHYSICQDKISEKGNQAPKENDYTKSMMEAKELSVKNFTRDS